MTLLCCAECIRLAGTTPSMNDQPGAGGFSVAVTVMDGDALCGPHARRRIGLRTPQPLPDTEPEP